MATIGERILTLMKQRGFTQRELASMVGVTDSAMSRYISGEREPKIDVIANLATALNTTSDYLINGKQDSESFSEIYKLVARSANTMTNEEKYELIRVLMQK